jgi:hypothetical protein
MLRTISRLGIMVVAMAAMALVIPGVAAARDRNHDNLPDRWERNHNLSLKLNQARRNQDGDALVNRQEFRANTNPRKSDSDGDGIPDGREGTGTIASFDGTTLVIDTFAGGTLSGVVTPDTEITCEAQDVNGDGDSSDEEGDDDTGSGSGDGKAMSATSDDPSGDDDQGEDPEDDADQVPCTAADLTPGTAVHEAEVENGAFTDIELVK